MKAKLVRRGNPRGARLPEPRIEQAGLTDVVELEVHGDTIVIVAPLSPAIFARVLTVRQEMFSP